MARSSKGGFCWLNVDENDLDARKASKSVDVRSLKCFREDMSNSQHRRPHKRHVMTNNDHNQLLNTAFDF